MVLLRILQWLLRPVSSLLYALFVLVSPRRGAEREEPLTQRGQNLHLTQRGQFQAVIEEYNVFTELKKKKNQLRGSENTVTALQEKVKQRQYVLKMIKENRHIKSGLSNEENVNPAQFFSTPPPPPPPLHPLVHFTSPIDPLDALRKRKTFGHNTNDMKNVKTRAMDETMERIKKGVVLKPTQKPPQTGLEKDSLKLETKMEEKMKINNQLRVSENTVTALQEKVKQLQDMLKMVKENPLIESGPSNEKNVTSALSSTHLPPPPPPPYLSTSLTDPLDTLRKSKKPGNNTTDLKKPAQSIDVKARAMDEMMERIKKGVVLKPTQKPPQTGLDEDSLKM